jgi:cystathionine gamma-lyase
MHRVGRGYHTRKSIHGLKKRTDSFGTRVIRAGSELNPETGAVIPPISLSATYKQDAVEYVFSPPYRDNS